MKIDFSQGVNGIDGKPFTEKNADTGIIGPITLAQLCSAALLTSFQDEPGLAGTEKFARYNLAAKVYGGGSADIAVEDIAKIKLCVGKFYAASVVGPVFNALEGTAAKVVYINQSTA